MKRQTRIITLLVIDSLFFVLEIVVGYAVHSLALVADSFHMLNDVFSLIVALYAIKLAARQTASPKYSYGWQRAEILGALINGVFLLALCLSIFLEAIQRFVEPQVVTQPVLILVVGSAGLASNIVGLVLFHEHSHEGHGHSHGEGDVEAGEHDHPGSEEANPASVDPTDDGTIAEVLPETVVRRASTIAATSPMRKKTRDKSRHSFASADDIAVSPSANRRSIVYQAEEIRNSFNRHSDDPEGEPEEGYNGDTTLTSEAETLQRRPGITHEEHRHTKAKEASTQKRPHGNMNMKAVFLHVMGDALGNIGVIATALFIWLTDFSWRYYSDPVISLIITAIIFSSALPLVKSASLILLQGVPQGVSLEDVKADILEIYGVVNVHELHIWQLSDVKMVASVHIQVNLPKVNRVKRYHQIARAIRDCLHAYGIHSSTIQPEFTDSALTPTEEVVLDDEVDEEDAALLGDGAQACMFECGAGGCADNRCCGPDTGNSNSNANQGTGSTS